MRLKNVRESRPMKAFLVFSNKNRKNEPKIKKELNSCSRMRDHPKETTKKIALEHH